VLEHRWALQKKTRKSRRKKKVKENILPSRKVRGRKRRGKNKNATESLLSRASIRTKAGTVVKRDHK